MVDNFMNESITHLQSVQLMFHKLIECLNQFMSIFPSTRYHN